MILISQTLWDSDIPFLQAHICPPLRENILGHDVKNKSHRLIFSKRLSAEFPVVFRTPLYFNGNEMNSASRKYSVP